MVLLAKNDVGTKEVLDWKGLHLLHYHGSTCSKKIRICLGHHNMKWTSHPINLLKRENNSEWFMGINPRGLVPVLVHNGQVHIESNDILAYLDRLSEHNTLIPDHKWSELNELLQIEDSLHIHLRNLTIRFTAPNKVMQRSSKELERYERTGSGLLHDTIDPHKLDELNYWRAFAQNKGITDVQVIDAVDKYNDELCRLDKKLQNSLYLIGDTVTLADISWFVTINRIYLAGYPIKKLHPHVWEWRERLIKLPSFAKEANAPLLQKIAAKVIRMHDLIRGKTLSKIANL